MSEKVRTKNVRRAGLVVCLLAVSLMSFASPLRADEAAEKKAADLLEKYVAATGGAEAFAKIKTRVSELTVTMPAANVEIKLTAYTEKPNKNFLLIESDAIGKVEQGCDGQVVWEKSDLTGCRIKTGNEKAMALREATLDRFVNWQNTYAKAEYRGMEDVEGKSCHKILMTPKATDADVKEDPESIYFDPDTSMIVKIATTVHSEIGELPVAMIISDYRDVDGVKLSHKMKVLAAGQEQLMTLDSVKNNVEISPDRFALPADVQQMLKKKD